MSGLLRAAQEHAVQQYRNRAAAIEQACEQMICSSQPLGVLVQDYPGGWRVTLSAEVPTWHINYKHLDAAP